VRARSAILKLEMFSQACEVALNPPPTCGADQNAANSIASYDANGSTQGHSFAFDLVGSCVRQLS
jgi:hypothetical protein